MDIGEMPVYFARKERLVLTLDYMSSEESDTDENGKTVYKVKRLPWRSNELKKKKSLDKQHLESSSSSTKKVRKNIKSTKKILKIKIIFS